MQAFLQSMPGGSSGNNAMLASLQHNNIGDNGDDSFPDDMLHMMREHAKSRKRKRIHEAAKPKKRFCSALSDLDRRAEQSGARIAVEQESNEALPNDAPVHFDRVGVEDEDEDAAPDVDTAQVTAIQFGLMGPDEARRLSVVEVTKQRLFDKGSPVADGLYDLRMGTVQRQFSCLTCAQKFKDCPGHFGRIELASPVFHPNFLDTVVKILNTICIDCSSLLVPKTKRFVERQARCRRAKDRLRFAHDCVKSKTTNKQCNGTPVAQRHRVPLCDLRAGILIGRGQDRAGVGIEGERGASVGTVQPLEHGCGHWQPKVVRDGMTVVLKYPDLPASERRSASSTADTKKQKQRKNKASDATDEQTDAADAQTGSAAKKEKEQDRVRRERAGTQRVLFADEAHAVLQRIADEDCWLMGFDPNLGHPSWMILTVLLVPPPSVRPPIFTPHGRKPMAQDHLTIALLDIVKKNKALKRQLEHDISAFTRQYKLLLQFHVATYIDNDSKGLPKATMGESARPRVSIAQRFKTKKGRLRGNLMGKRVDFGARTVITPDACIGLNEIGVPPWVAMSLTFSECVNRHNISRLQRAVTLGPDHLSGAKFVVDTRGRSWDLSVKRDIALKYGYYVERHLRNGDLCALNRQPSLHKESIMGHYVRITPRLSFGLNLSATGPYNADFDGDEMNLHFPQTEKARAELIELMDVGKCIVSPQANSPIIGLVQDTLLAARLITTRDVLFNRADVMQMIMWARISCADCALPAPCIVKPEALWSGKQIISLLWPRTLNIGPSGNSFRPDDEAPDDAMTPSDTRVLVRNGQLLSGILDKKFLGARAGSIIHLLFNDHGANVARIFIEEMQAVLRIYMMEIRCFGVGIGDCMVDESVKRRVREVVKQTTDAVDELADRMFANDVTPEPGMSVQQTFESSMNQLLNRARDKAGRVVSGSLDVHTNNLKLMVTAGSKGADVNIAQIAGIVGQQNVNGERMPQTFGHRALPHAKRHDLCNVADRGFVAENYIDGLTPTSMFTHAMGGREGLVDTAVKTGTIGYIQRRLIKAGEDVAVAADRTVRNSVGRIVQFVYGEDDLDGAKFEWQKFPLIGMSNADVRATFGDEHSDVLQREVTELLAFRDAVRRAIYPRNETRLPLPGNLLRTIVKAKREMPSPPPIPNLDLCAQVFDLLHTWQQDMERATDPAARDLQRTRASMLLYVAFVRSTLSPRVALETHRLSPVQVNWILKRLAFAYQQSRVADGEAVGVLSAQAIGEPATQMTLNTFHFAGISAKNVTLGVPRLEEVIKATDSIKSPSMTLHLTYNPFVNDAHHENHLLREARALAGRLKHVKLGDVVKLSEILYEPIGTLPSSPRDAAAVERWRATQVPSAVETRNEQFGPLIDWCLRLGLSRGKLFECGLSPTSVGYLLTRHFDGAVEVIVSDDNDVGVDGDDDGGFIRLRMHAFSVIDALRGALPVQRRGVLDEMEDALLDQCQESTGTGTTSVSATVTANRKRRRRKSVQRMSSRIDDDDDDDEDDEDDENHSVASDIDANGALELPGNAAWGSLDATICFPMMMRHFERETQEVVLHGVEKITEAFVRDEARTLYDPTTGELLANAKEWILETNGSNLSATFALDGIDHTRTTCNNPAEVTRVLGIEAGRACLLRELRHVMQFDGAYVNHRHLAMLCDIMTQGGTLMAINRHGLNRRQTGPLMRATMEMSVAMLMDAGCYSEFDPLTGPSERIALGQRVFHGTGTHIEVLIDPSYATNAKKSVDDDDDDSDDDDERRIDTSTCAFGSNKHRNEQQLMLDVFEYRRAEKKKREATMRAASAAATAAASAASANVETVIGPNPFGASDSKPVLSDVVVEREQPPISTKVHSPEVIGADAPSSFADSASGRQLPSMQNPFSATLVTTKPRHASIAVSSLQNPFSATQSTDTALPSSAPFSSAPLFDPKSAFDSTASSHSFYVPSSPSRWPSSHERV